MLTLNNNIMGHSKLLHQALENIDWDYVSRSFRGSGIQWYGSEKPPTKKDLTTDLTEIIETAFENLESDPTSTQTVTPYWIVCIEEDEETSEILLEIIFTPFALFINSKGTNQTQRISLEKLNVRLDIALQRENYEIAALIQEVIDNYNTKK